MSIAFGWSPVGRYASDVLNGGTRSSVASMAVATEAPERAPSQPHGAYAAIFGTFLGGLAAAGAIARLLHRRAGGRAPARPDRHPRHPPRPDFLLFVAATFKAARTIARDEVTSFLREPFVEGEAGSGHDEEPVQTGGMQQAIGELVTCSRCIGTWAAAGIATTQTVAPRFGRLLTWTLGAAGANDFLQAGFAALTHKSNELEQRAG